MCGDFAFFPPILSNILSAWCLGAEIPLTQFQGISSEEN